ncbi:hypothetical protein RHSIM_Rhsim11G0067200 [Rhododendron simsii]|uniref:Uncharacterized protein n=1 Tax=Rhododendron simsii TaxID=118357 RepID=A0A834G7N3_RHOSS|nr:hypothetical protein RHSIM_Rhsim11G0067200 [Rhododendron simsii]
MTNSPTIITLHSASPSSAVSTSPASSPPVPTAAAKPPSPAEAPATAAAASGPERSGGETDHVDGLAPAILAGINGELDPLALPEGPEPVGPDLRLVDEEILAAVVRRHEPEPLLAAEPLHRPRYPLRTRHSYSRRKKQPNNRALIGSEEAESPREEAVE